MSSILAVIVSYHPNEDINKNVKALLLQVAHIVIVDNETSEQSKRVLAAFSESEISFIFNTENKGVGEGFNQGIRWGLEKHYDYFLLMDQDSCPQPGMAKKLLEVAQFYLENNQLVLVGPQHEDYERKIRMEGAEGVESVPLLISSGSLLSRKLISEIGLYDERLFIDHVDHDYCLRIAQKKGLCLKVNSAILLHKFGQAQVRSFLGKTFFLQEYSPFRRYHMMRNRIVLYKRYGMFKGAWFWIDLKIAVKDLVKLLFFESQKKAKIAALTRGFKDGVLWSDSK